MIAKLMYKAKPEDKPLAIGQLSDNPPFFYILSDLGNDILYDELRFIQQDVEYNTRANKFDLDNYIKFYNGKLFFIKDVR